MKSRPRRLGALAVFLLLLCSLAHSPGQASSASAYFTAVNDQLMPLNDETMPFYSNGVLYVSTPPNVRIFNKNLRSTLLFIP